MPNTSDSPWEKFSKQELWEFYMNKGKFVTHAGEYADKWEDQAHGIAIDRDRLREALKLFVDMPEQFSDGEFLEGLARMKAAFKNAREVLQSLTF